MSLNKAIEHGKEHRKPYRGGKAIDKTCRNHGGCPACESNRMHKYEKAMPAPDNAKEPVNLAAALMGISPKEFDELVRLEQIEKDLTDAYFANPSPIKYKNLTDAEDEVNEYRRKCGLLDTHRLYAPAP